MLTVDVNLRIFYDKATKAIVCLHDADNRFGCDKTTQTFHTDLRRCAERFLLLYKPGGINAFCVGDFDNLSANFVHHLEYLVAKLHVYASFPVVAMDDVVGFRFLKFGI